MNLVLELSKKFKNNISHNVELSNYSWFNLGGPAEHLFKPYNKEQLIEFLEINKKNNLNITILGAGSNTLIRDNGIKGVVIKLGSNFSNINLTDKNIIEVGAATLDRKIANFAKENGIGNLEFLSCIPGSIGGAVIMNSGCYGNDISKVLVSINVIDTHSGKEKEIKRKDINFFYRGTNLPNHLIITSVKLKGIKTDKVLIEKKQKKFIEEKKLSQPSQIKTCGSTFKNLSSERKAWKLIKDTGCEELKEGDASISNKHCNFFVNNGNASATDIEKLINKVKKRVAEKTGVNLELEIKIIGE
ncbi:MAG: UDP-N-acetylenolpyruvoylglucosamine reductase [Pseudomonadota bacterium]|nr:MAG: UDP-N-acetylenolpyruvoylglucosamine reductase [Pseudomonadota bacterium]